MLHPGPDSKDELIETLVEAQDNDVIGAQSREMLEGVIRMADMTAGDVMTAWKTSSCLRFIVVPGV